MFIDTKRELCMTRVAGSIAWSGRTVLAGERVRIWSYTDRNGRKWTVAAWDWDPLGDPYEDELLEVHIRRELRMFVQNYIRRF